MLEILHAERLDWRHIQHSLLHLGEMQGFWRITVAVVLHGDELVGEHIVEWQLRHDT